MDSSTSSAKFRTCHAQKISMPSNEKSNRPNTVLLCHISITLRNRILISLTVCAGWTILQINRVPWDLNHKIFRFGNFTVGTISVKLAQKISAAETTYVWLLMSIFISRKSVTISLSLLLSAVRSFLDEISKELYRKAIGGES
jgi:hypothetical protein